MLYIRKWPELRPDVFIGTGKQVFVDVPELFAGTPLRGVRKNNLPLLIQIEIWMYCENPACIGSENMVE